MNVIWRSNVYFYKIKKIPNDETNKQSLNIHTPDRDVSCDKKDVHVSPMFYFTQAVNPKVTKPQLNSIV